MAFEKHLNLAHEMEWCLDSSQTLEGDLETDHIQADQSAACHRPWLAAGHCNVKAISCQSKAKRCYPLRKAVFM